MEPQSDIKNKKMRVISKRRTVSEVLQFALWKAGIVLSLFIALLPAQAYGENLGRSDPVLTGSSDERILGQTLPAGTYRIVPKLQPGQRKAAMKVILDDKNIGSPKITSATNTGKIPDQAKANDGQNDLPYKLLTGDIEDPDSPVTPSAQAQKKPKVTELCASSTAAGPSGAIERLQGESFAVRAAAGLGEKGVYSPYTPPWRVLATIRYESSYQGGPL